MVAQKFVARSRYRRSMYVSLRIVELETISSRVKTCGQATPSNGLSETEELLICLQFLVFAEHIESVDRKFLVNHPTHVFGLSLDIGEDALIDRPRVLQEVIVSRSIFRSPDGERYVNRVPPLRNADGGMFNCLEKSDMPPWSSPATCSAELFAPPPLPLGSELIESRGIHIGRLLGRASNVEI
jgi:hypothetical protein